MGEFVGQPDVLLPVALGLGVLTAAVARHYGRDPLGWGLLGAALFIVALPALLLLGPRKGPPTADEEAAGVIKRSHVVWALAQGDRATWDEIVDRVGHEDEGLVDDLNECFDAGLVTAISGRYALTPLARSHMPATLPGIRPAPSGSDPSQRLRSLNALRDDGLITDEEYAERRRTILDEL